MPSQYRDELDTPASFEAVGSFDGGQVSYAKPRLLSTTQSALLQNCEIEITGQVSTRFGTAYIGGTIGTANYVAGLAYFNAPSNTYEVAWVDSGDIRKWNGSSWVQLVASNSFTVADFPSMVQGANKLYIAAGDDIRSWDGTAYTILSGDGATQGPRNASILVWFTNRLIAAGASIKSLSTDTVPVPDAIYFSNFLDAANWGATKGTQQIRVGAGDGQAVTAVVPWTQFNLAVFKRRSVWVVNADPSITVANMTIQLVHGSVGCVARKTAMQVGADIFFLADDGVRSLSSVAASDQREELSVPLSYPVQDYINRINPAAASGAAAIFWRNRYILALPLDSSTTNNYILVYNTITKSWSGVWTNLPVNVFAVRLVSSAPRLMMGFSNATRVIESLDYTLPANWVNATFADYDATQVQPRITTKAYMFDDPLALKLGMGGEIEWNNSNGTLSVVPILDEVTKTGPTLDVSSGGFTPPVTPPFAIAPNGLSRARFDLMHYGEFREMQLDITGLTGGRKELRQLSAAGFVRPTLVGNS